jgi:hypothetical protein
MRSQARAARSRPLAASEPNLRFHMLTGARLSPAPDTREVVLRTEAPALDDGCAVVPSSRISVLRRSGPSRLPMLPRLGPFRIQSGARTAMEPIGATLELRDLPS